MRWINKQFFWLGLLLLPLFLSACAKQVAPSVSQGDNQTPSPSASSSPATQPTTNEGLIIATLAAKEERSTDKYLLHDLNCVGAYCRGRFSFDNQLQPPTFWAEQTDGIWQIIFSSAEVPNCDRLSVAGFPTALTSGCYEDLNVKQISNFNDCLQASGAISGQGPRQCRDAKGNVFVEAIKPAASKRYVSRDLVKCRALDFTCQPLEKNFLDDSGCGCQQ